MRNAQTPGKGVLPANPGGGCKRISAQPSHRGFDSRSRSCLHGHDHGHFPLHFRNEQVPVTPITFVMLRSGKGEAIPVLQAGRLVILGRASADGDWQSGLGFCPEWSRGCQADELGLLPIDAAELL